MDNSQAFIESLFVSATHLYGAIFLCDLWEIYRYSADKNDYVSVSLEEMVSFAQDAVGQERKYTVIPIEELYDDELPRMANCVIANNRMILDKYNKYEIVYKILKMASDKPYFIPENILNYEYPLLTVVEREAEELLGNLMVTQDKYITRWKTELPCENVGKCLSEFDFLNQDERFKVDYISGKVKGGPKLDQKKLDQYMEYHAGPENLKLIREFRWKTSTASTYPIEAAEYVLAEIAETGVLVTDEERMAITRKLLEIYNTSRLWINRGWQPKQIKQLARDTDENVINVIGPGAHKALNRGDIPVEKLVEAIRNNGFEVSSFDL